MLPPLATSPSSHWGCGLSRVQVSLGCIRRGSDPTPYLRQTPVPTWILKPKATDPRRLWLTMPHPHPRVSLIPGSQSFPSTLGLWPLPITLLPCKLSYAFKAYLLSWAFLNAWRRVFRSSDLNFKYNLWLFFYPEKLREILQLKDVFWNNLFHA